FSSFSHSRLPTFPGNFGHDNTPRDPTRREAHREGCFRQPEAGAAMFRPLSRKVRGAASERRPSVELLLVRRSNHHLSQSDKCDRLPLHLASRSRLRSAEFFQPSVSLTTYFPEVARRATDRLMSHPPHRRAATFAHCALAAGARWPNCEAHIYCSLS